MKDVLAWEGEWSVMGREWFVMHLGSHSPRKLYSRRHGLVKLPTIVVLDLRGNCFDCYYRFPLTLDAEHEITLGFQGGGILDAKL